MDSFDGIADCNALLRMLASNKSDCPDLPYRQLYEGLESNSGCSNSEHEALGCSLLVSGDVTVRSRESIINAVLHDTSLIKDILGWCSLGFGGSLKMTVNRTNCIPRLRDANNVLPFLLDGFTDNTRAHIKRVHPGREVRAFVDGVDGNLEQVRVFNENKKGKGIGFDTGKPMLRRARGRRASLGPGAVASFTESRSPFDRRSEEEAMTSTLNSFVSAIAAPMLVAVKVEDANLTGLSAENVSILSAPTLDNNSTSAFLKGPTAENESPDDKRQPTKLRFGCVQCHQSYAEADELEGHVAKVHRTFFRCNECLAEFVKIEHLTQHYSFTH